MFLMFKQMLAGHGCSISLLALYLKNRPDLLGRRELYNMLAEAKGSILFWWL